MDLDQGKQIFIEESRELLQDMDQALLALEQSQEDPELINRIFRVAHTIKGNSGMFGLDPVVAFTHVLETLLDQVRGGTLPLSSDLLPLLFRSRDHLLAMVEACVRNQEYDTEETENLSGLLTAHGASPPPASPLEGCSHKPQSCSGCTQIKEHAYHISVRFGRQIFQRGMDPVLFLRGLSEMGSLCHAYAVVEGIPLLDHPDFDPEQCYLGFEIDLVTTASKEEIHRIFEFAGDDTLLFILPPNSKTSEYISLIQSMPEDDQVIGDYLIQCGVINPRELNAALQKQKQGGGYIGEILVESGVVKKEVVSVALDKQKNIRTQKVKESVSIRVDADKLELLINQVGEMVISSANVFQLCKTSAEIGLQESTSEMLDLVESLRETALSLRMVPIGETFNRFHRVVRDISQSVGKEISLTISGGETDLDKTVVEKINDPLVHLIRNAIDHGIEAADLRKERWKPVKGTIHLSAHHDAGTIVIQISDDGGGLSKERILKKAIEKGLVAPQHSLSDSEIFQLIFKAGFSTAEQVSNLSGRGVGMDVVKKNIEALRGSVDVSSTDGQGATVTIRLPLTLAIIDGFLVKVGESCYVIPLDMVVECVELTEEDRLQAHGRNYINLRGEVLPFVPLRSYLGESGMPGIRENIVIVQSSGKKSGLVVDGLLGEIQTVIKPLGKLFQGLPGVSGATILGSGQVALILDVPTLIQHVVGHESLATAAIG